MTDQEFINELRLIARRHRDSESMIAEARAKFPGTAIAICYCGPMFMGMVMSHQFPNVHSF